MTDTPTTLPGYWRFAWMFFMQPVRLHEQLKASGVDLDEVSGWGDWKQRNRLPPAYGAYVQRLASLLLISFLGALIVFLERNTLIAATTNEKWDGWGIILIVSMCVEIGVAFGVAFGVLGVLKGGEHGVKGGGLAGGLAVGLVGLVLGVLLYEGAYIVIDASLTVAHGQIVGMVIGMMVGIVAGVAVDVLEGVVEGVAKGVAKTSSGSAGVGAAIGVVVGVVLDKEFGATVSVFYLVFKLRIWAFLPEAILQTLLAWRGEGLCFSPVLKHELCFFPYPGLARLMLRTAEHDPALVRRVLSACEIAPGQRKIGRRVLAQLQGEEVGKQLRCRQFQALLELRGEWLPSASTDNPMLQAFAQLAHSLAAAQNSSVPYLAQQNLALAAQRLQALDIQRLASDELIARYLLEPVVVANQVLEAMQAETVQAAAASLPNPFIAGNPLSGRQRWGMQLFRGREAQVSRVERLLADRDTANSFALLGPRRCGKSTLVNMLRKQLPDTQVVLFDLQDNPADTPLRLYQALARQAQRQAQEDRQLQLPAFASSLAPTDSAIEALKTWLDALEQCPGVARFLICIDEFKRLPSLFPAAEASLAGVAGRELQQFMGLLRATIQHRQRVRLLVAGAAPFDELERLWTDHFINLQEIGVGFLDRAAAEGLLTAPCKEMPKDAIPPAVAQAIVTRSAGQPYLTQLYGQILVDHLNEQKRHQAALSDVEPVERHVLSQGGNYFRNIWSEINPKAQAALASLAFPESSANNPPKLDSSTRRYLQRRLLIDESGTPQPPVFVRWLREEVLEDEPEAGHQAVNSRP